MTKPSSSFHIVLIAAAVSIGCAIAASAVTSMLATPSIPGAPQPSGSTAQDHGDEIAALRADLEALRSETRAAREHGDASGYADSANEDHAARLESLEQRLARLMNSSDARTRASNGDGRGQPVGGLGGLTDEDLDARVAAALERVRETEAQGERAEYADEYKARFERFFESLAAFNVDPSALDALRATLADVIDGYINGDVDDIESELSDAMSGDIDALVGGIGDSGVDWSWNGGPTLSVRRTGTSLRSSQSADEQLQRSFRMNHPIVIDSAGIHTVWVEFDSSLGDIDVRLLDDGDNEIASSTSVSDRETITRWFVPGEYRVQVYFYDDSGNRSDYAIGVDARSAAYLSVGQAVSLDLAPQHDAVFELNLAGPEGLQFEVDGIESASLTVFNSDNSVVLENSGEEVNRLVVQGALMQGRWYVRVMNWADSHASATMTVARVTGD